MIEAQALFITQFLTLWAVLDPISHLPLFMAATTALSAREKRWAAVLSILFALGVLVFFGLAGQYLLHGMGISLLSFQIAGGIILLLFAISMVLGATADHAGHAADADAPRRDTALGVAVYPLATPIIAGPGAILSIVLLMDNNRFSFTEHLTTIAALIVALLMLLLIFLTGTWIERAIGQAGLQLVRRIMGLLLAAMAVNLMLRATSAWLQLPPP